MILLIWRRNLLLPAPKTFEAGNLSMGNVITRRTLLINSGLGEYRWSTCLFFLCLIHFSRELLHIYRMRTLGYPPGWLKKAAIGGSLQIFDSDNLDSVTSERKVSYNRSALIGYPGFNVELDRSVRDDYLFLKCPPMQKYHMLDNFYASLSGESSEKSSITSANGNPSPCSIKKTVETAITISDSESGETNSTSSQMEDTPDEVEVLRPNPDFLIVHAAEQGTPTPICPLTVTNDFPNENTDHSSFLSSQALKRPSLEAFSMGIQPYRPFENLPGVHGGYQRVLKSLKNSRESLASHSNPSDSKNLRDNDFQSPSARLNRHNGIQSPHKRSRY
ncbi:unnamed protein product [Schistosoma turkestanicum]|nr:unnamed protein product [Schistosoma turkestanicum]